MTHVPPDFPRPARTIEDEIELLRLEIELARAQADLARVQRGLPEEPHSSLPSLAHCTKLPPRFDERQPNDFFSVFEHAATRADF